MAAQSLVSREARKYLKLALDVLNTLNSVQILNSVDLLFYSAKLRSADETAELLAFREIMELVEDLFDWL